MRDNREMEKQKYTQQETKQSGWIMKDDVDGVSSTHKLWNTI
jgi:hypothetical protein